MSTDTFIVLLRGVMPTGKNKVKMADLRKALTDAGFRNVRTWIQSGNVLLDTECPREEIAGIVRETIRNKLGPDLHIIVKTEEEIRRILEENPFRDRPRERIFYAMTEESLPVEATDALKDEDYGEEELIVTDHALYMHIPGDASRSRLSGSRLERKLKVPVTVRNRNTLEKLVQMAGEG